MFENSKIYMLPPWYHIYWCRSLELHYTGKVNVLKNYISNDGSPTSHRFPGSYGYSELSWNSMKVYTFLSSETDHHDWMYETWTICSLRFECATAYTNFNTYKMAHGTVFTQKPTITHGLFTHQDQCVCLCVLDARMGHIFPSGMIKA